MTSTALRVIKNGLLAAGVAGCSSTSITDSRIAEETTHAPTIEAPAIASLESLSIEALRNRNYGAELVVEQLLGTADDDTEYSRHFSQDGSAPYSSFLTSYRSDGLRMYARVDIPATPLPVDGYPVVMFLHGWVGIDNAPKTDFYYSADSYYSAWIDGYVDAGFVVVTPGYRGHGTVNGVPAEGIEFLATWDNGSYISPVFYTIDVLNLLDGLHSLERIGWREWNPRAREAIRLDRRRINISGHSQGGDVALMVLAVSGEGSTLKTSVAAGSIWAGTFPDRFTQLETYHAMQVTPQAFMSGDGSWNGSAIGADGSENPNFIFGYPPDWIGTVDQAQWTWQKDTWSTPTVADALTEKAQQMYDAVNANVGEINDASFSVQTAANGKAYVLHDSRVTKAMASIGAFDKPQYLTEPLALQHSDQDLYSLPGWNADLCLRINNAGGSCADFTYPKNSHSLKKSEHSWFSDDQTTAGFPYAIKRDIALFKQQDPRKLQFP